ncbi:hypothetical protein IKM56_01695 [Candidatus Saccharibacteria bacterium]|nr:hypothetical protein [Candidatus Saccharibacteria bacterium]
MSEKLINKTNGLSATITRDDSTKELESIVIEYNPDQAGVLDDDKFADLLRDPVYNALTADEVHGFYTMTYRNELGTFVFEIVPDETSTTDYAALWDDLYHILVESVDGDGSDDGDDESTDDDDETPDDEDEDEDKDKKGEPKKSEPTKSKTPEPKKSEPKKSEPAKKPEPKKPFKSKNGMTYDGDRYHSDDDDTEEALDEFYSVFNASLNG